jgi:hypothetical protein
VCVSYEWTTRRARIVLPARPYWGTRAHSSFYFLSLRRSRRRIYKYIKKFLQPIPSEWLRAPIYNSSLGAQRSIARRELGNWRDVRVRDILPGAGFTGACVSPDRKHDSPLKLRWWAPLWRKSKRRWRAICALIFTHRGQCKCRGLVERKWQFFC